MSSSIDNCEHGHEEIRFKYKNTTAIKKEIWFIKIPGNDRKITHRIDGPAVLEYFFSKRGELNVWKEKWYLNGRLHRMDGPAYIEYDINSRKIKEEWYIHGKLHSIDGPARITYHDMGRSIRSKEWFFNGWAINILDMDAPSEIHYYYNGDILSETWYRNVFKEGYAIINGKEVKSKNLIHRLDGPAYIEYNNKTDKEYEVWYKNGKRFRSNNEPDYIGYYENGTVYKKDWSNLSNDDTSPSTICYHPNGNIEYEQWMTNCSTAILRDSKQIINFGKPKHTSQIPIHTGRPYMKIYDLEGDLIDQKWFDDKHNKIKARRNEEINQWLRNDNEFNIPYDYDEWTDEHKFIWFLTFGGEDGTT